MVERERLAIDCNRLLNAEADLYTVLRMRVLSICSRKSLTHAEAVTCSHKSAKGLSQCCHYGVS